MSYAESEPCNRGLWSNALPAQPQINFIHLYVRYISAIWAVS